MRRCHTSGSSNAVLGSTVPESTTSRTRHSSGISLTSGVTACTMPPHTTSTTYFVCHRLFNWTVGLFMLCYVMDGCHSTGNDLDDDHSLVLIWYRKAAAGDTRSSIAGRRLAVCLDRFSFLFLSGTSSHSLVLNERSHRDCSLTGLVGRLKCHSSSLQVFLE